MSMWPWRRRRPRPTDTPKSSTWARTRFAWETYKDWLAPTSSCMTLRKQRLIPWTTTFAKRSWAAVGASSSRQSTPPALGFHWAACQDSLVTEPGTAHEPSQGQGQGKGQDQGQGKGQGQGQGKG